MTAIVTELGRCPLFERLAPVELERVAKAARPLAYTMTLAARLAESGGSISVPSTAGPS